jgi:hypothetical protein
MYCKGTTILVPLQTKHQKTTIFHPYFRVVKCTEIRPILIRPSLTGHQAEHGGSSGRA